MGNKKTLIAIVAIIAVAVAAFLISSGNTGLFKGFIGVQPSTGKIAPGTECPSTSPCIAPSNTVSRGEFTAILSRNISGLAQSGLVAYTNCFPDTVGYKYENYVCYAAAKGWVLGFADGSFHPEDFISRAEAAKYIVVAFGINPYVTPNQMAFDVPKTVWFYDYVNTMIRYKIVPLIADAKGKKWFFPGVQLSKTDALSWVKKMKAAKK